jgi:hypothetical protein
MQKQKETNQIQQITAAETKTIKNKLNQFNKQ